MSRPKINCLERENVKGRIFQVVLFDDSESYDTDKVLDNIRTKSDQFAIIHHNYDKYSISDWDEYIEKNNKTPDWKVGDDKKPHYHCIAIFGNSKTLGFVSRLFSIASNYVQIVKNKTGAIQYLVHKNNPEKYQYDYHHVESNIVNIEKKFFDMENDVKANSILNEIMVKEACGEYISIKDMILWTINNNCWDEFRRGQHIWTACINECNGKRKE